MRIFRPRHDNLRETIAASPVRTLYGRKGSLLLAPLDLCILLAQNGQEEFRTSFPAGRFLAAPVLEAGGGRLGLISGYRWPPAAPGELVSPVVLLQAAPSADIRGIADVERIAAQADVGDTVHLGSGAPAAAGRVRHLIQRHPYPDLAHRVEAYRVEFSVPVPKEAHGAPVYLGEGEGSGEGEAALLGMLIATDNQAGGTCRALVYPA